MILLLKYTQLFTKSVYGSKDQEKASNSMSVTENFFTNNRSIVLINNIITVAIEDSVWQYG